MSLTNDLGESACAVERVEDVRERARKHTLDLDDLVPRRDRSTKRVDDRETGADVCFVEKISLMFARCVAQAHVSREGTGVALLVGCDDVDPSGDPILIVLRHFGARGCVDDHCVWQVFGVYVIEELFDVCVKRAFVQRVAPTVEKNLPVVKNHLPAVHDAAHSQIDTTFWAQLLKARGELVQKRSADQSGADHADRKSLT